MIARGDLGVEIPMEQVPYYQKMMIKKCLERGIPVITATQMLISMTQKPYPTRAEVSDVANAAYDFTDAVMLSEETAVGQYPEQVVNTMAETVDFSEKQNILNDTRNIFEYLIVDSEEMLCDTAYNLYLRFDREKEPIGGFIVFSETGRTGRKLSRYRPKAPIFVFVPDRHVQDSLTTSYAVMPFIQPGQMKENNVVRIEDMKEAFAFLIQKEKIDPDKRYILLYGDNWGIEGGVSTVKIVYPKNLD
jgi:pyruvate kinase